MLGCSHHDQEMNHKFVSGAGRLYPSKPPFDKDERSAPSTVLRGLLLADSRPVITSPTLKDPERHSRLEYGNV